MMAGEMPRPDEELPEDDPYSRVIAAVTEGRVAIAPDFSVSPIAPDKDDIGEELRTIGATIAVYRAAGLAMAETTDAMRFRAGQLAHILSVIAGSDEAPQAMVEQAMPAIEEWLGAWTYVLEGIMQFNPTSAERVLASLVASHPNVPTAFREPRKDQLSTANRVLKNYRVARGKIGSASRISAWGLSVKFAKAFGVTMNAKRSGATRPKKTTRTRTKKQTRAR